MPDWLVSDIIYRSFDKPTDQKSGLTASRLLGLLQGIHVLVLISSNVSIAIIYVSYFTIADNWLTRFLIINKIFRAERQL